MRTAQDTTQRCRGPPTKQGQRIPKKASTQLIAFSQQRCRDEPSERAGDSQSRLDTKKSRVGLGEIYAQQYEKEVLGAVDETETKEKAEAKRLFAKVRHARLEGAIHICPVGMKIVSYVALRKEREPT